MKVKVERFLGGNDNYAICQLEDGTWFVGNFNEFGYIYKTFDAIFNEGLSSEWDDSSVFVRYVDDINEQYLIWQSIYTQMLESNGKQCQANPPHSNCSECGCTFCKEYLASLKEDLETQSFNHDKVTI